MKSGGSVIFSIVPQGSLLPSSSRSSQNSVGPTDRNSLPCRYQSPSLLTIILICLSLLFSLPKPQRLLPTLRKQGFTVIVADSWSSRFICLVSESQSSAMSPAPQNYNTFHSGGGSIQILKLKEDTNKTKNPSLKIVHQHTLKDHLWTNYRVIFRVNFKSRYV